MGAGNQTEPPVGLSQLLLVPGLDKTKHHSSQRHASSCPPPQATIFCSIGPLTAHGADEIGAHFPLALAHLQQQQRSDNPFQVAFKQLQINGYNIVIRTLTFHAVTSLTSFLLKKTLNATWGTCDYTCPYMIQLCFSPTSRCPPRFSFPLFISTLAV